MKFNTEPHNFRPEQKAAEILEACLAPLLPNRLLEMAGECCVGLAQFDDVPLGLRLEILRFGLIIRGLKEQEADQFLGLVAELSRLVAQKSGQAAA